MISGRSFIAVIVLALLAGPSSAVEIAGVDMPGALKAGLRLVLNGGETDHVRPLGLRGGPVSQKEQIDRMPSSTPTNHGRKLKIPRPPSPRKDEEEMEKALDIDARETWPG
jgi:hypothetical protein